MYRSCKGEERCGLDLKMLLRKFCYFLSLYLNYSSGFAVIKKISSAGVCVVCVCVWGGEGGGVGGDGGVHPLYSRMVKVKIISIGQQIVANMV